MPTLDQPRIVLAGTSSGVGKTIVSAAIARALTRRGLRVQTFKAGPDFIDPSFLTIASGRPCHNLDTWMMPRSAVLTVAERAANGADVMLIEGMMGLFDGRGPVSPEGSTAQLATWLRAPVVLLLDASRASRSTAALVRGYRTFDRRVKVIAALPNLLATERHAAWVREAIESQSGTVVPGTLPRDDGLTLPSRHLGLVQAHEHVNIDAIIERAADLVEQCVDLDLLLQLSSHAPSIQFRDSHLYGESSGDVRIGVARDESFSFYYQANLDLLTSHGSILVPFSPLRDPELPANLSGLYLGGGYPELHAGTLARNESMLASIRAASAAGMPIYGECGGMIYLGNNLRDQDGNVSPLCGVLDIDAEMTSRRVALGYADVTATSESLLLKRGQKIRGHEYHWSRVSGGTAQDELPHEVVTSSDAHRDGYQSGSVFGGYVHLHFASNVSVAPRFVDACRQWRKMSMM